MPRIRCGSRGFGATGRSTDAAHSSGEGTRHGRLIRMNASAPRSLTTVERRVLETMLAIDFEGVETVRESAQHALVAGQCGCGCPSVSFVRDDPSEGILLVAEAIVADDPLQTVLLFTNDDGDLAALELMWMTDEPPPEFPDPARLRAAPA